MSPNTDLCRKQHTNMQNRDKLKLVPVVIMNFTIISVLFYNIHQIIIVAIRK